MARHILTVNVGSSSVKTAVFEGSDLSKVAAADVSAVGSPRARVTSSRGSDRPETGPAEAPDHRAAVRIALSALDLQRNGLAAVVHRIVHGGEVTAPQWIDEPLLAHLRTFSAVASEHLPPALDAIALTMAECAGVRQAACFDTAFHATLPRVARLLPLPRRFADAGVRRYGFHGLSCESVMETLRQEAPAEANGRIVIAHLGSGASLTAVRGGRSVETTMGFSPDGGVMMATRTGDLDPGVLVYAMEQEGLDAAGLRRLVTRESGLAGLSGSSSDMRELVPAAATDAAAADAVSLFSYTVRKALGALAAVLGGLDTIVFTGGIGEHAAAVRARTLDGLDDFGIALDAAANDANRSVVSPANARVTVRVLRSDEDRVLARHAASLLGRHS